MNDLLTPITTPTCTWCGGQGEMLVPVAGFLARSRGALVQDAYPDMSRQQREQIISGTHPECWEQMFGGNQ